jgi:hypothetical protein
METPTVANYQRAFRRIELTECQEKMLAKHYHAKNRTLTATQMSALMGWKGKAANLHYGGLAKKLKRQLKWRTKFHVEVLCFFWDDDREPIEWVMHANVARALRALDLV